MNTIKHILLAVMLTVATLPAWGQVSVGLRAGVTVNRLSLDREFVSSNNRAGYTGGLVLDLNIPVVGLGIEASAMYTYRKNRLTSDDRTYKRHYIDIPLYARYRLSLPPVQRYFAPYVFTGPCFSILFDDDAPLGINNSRTYTSWDVGAGADLFTHLRLSLSYGIGLTRAMELIDHEYTGRKVDGKDRHWTLSAAWLF
jgi:hypothetical protein